MPDITVCAIVKNEADRFLEAALTVWSDFSDRIVVVDDGSTDRTPEILGDFGCEVYEEELALWGNEAEAREFAWTVASAGSEWVFILDADMIPATKPDLRGKIAGFYLFDLWEPLKYREDAWWRAHRSLSPWAADVSGHQEHEWVWDRSRGIHAPRMPSNIGDLGPMKAAQTVLLHYAYATPELRAEKLARYASVEEQLRPKEVFHARSIADEKPRLFDLPFEPEYTLL